MTKAKKAKKKKLPPLTPAEQRLLGVVKMFPGLDKGSQERMRKQIETARKNSPSFEQAFGEQLVSSMGAAQMGRKTSVFDTVREALLHPIRTAKGEVGRALIKGRNKAPKILKHPHPTLSKIAEPVDFKKTDRKELEDIARKMGAALRATQHGQQLGIAAPQIGISKRIAVVKGAFCINPVFIEPSHGKPVEVIEGCYSLKDGELYTVKRYDYGYGEWYSIDGEKRRYRLKKQDAIVFQHEVDHLNGLCCCDTGVKFEPPKPEIPTKDTVKNPTVEVEATKKGIEVKD